MPTKPTPAVTPRWNTGLANQTAPSGGKIALGWEPLEDPSSSTFNWFMYETGELNQWTLNGSSAGGADAHIVETDANGDTAVRCLDVLGRANQRGIDVAAGTGTAVGIYSRGGTVGGQAMIAETTTAAFAILATAALGSNGSGIQVLSRGTGSGIEIETEEGDALVAAAGDSGNGRGVIASGYGTGQGVFASGATGVLSMATTVGGSGVEGQCEPSATTSGAGIFGLGQNDGAGGRFESANGYGVTIQADTTSPARATLRLVPQNADPSTAADGDMCMQDASNVTELRLRLEGAWRSAVWRTNGQCYLHLVSAGPTTEGAAAYTAAASGSFGAPNDPKRTGTVRLHLTAEVGRDTSVAGNIEIRVRDTTAGADALPARIVQLFQGTTTYERDISWSGSYTLPAAGARTFEVQIRRSGGANNVAIRNVSLVIEGVY